MAMSGAMVVRDGEERWMDGFGWAGSLVILLVDGELSGGVECGLDWIGCLDKYL
jgi:hypothetical protein